MGKHKYIETPEKLKELFEAYKEEVKGNPRIQYSLSNKTGKAEPVYLERPLTMSGFRVFGHKNGVTVHHYFSNTDDSYSEYRSICSYIEDEIKADQIDGGMVGQYNASITQRLNGLTERQDITSNSQSITGIDIRIVRPDED